MEDDTIESIVNKVAGASTTFEKNNTELKRKYLVWNIETFKIIASKVTGQKGSFGTGYPFYALDENLQGNLPIISEQLRYNRKLVKDSETVAKKRWTCKTCLKKFYEEMSDLKKVCNPCPKMIQNLKPRKIINRLPDMDMWIVCEDDCVNKAKEEVAVLLNKFGMKTSDVDPLSTIEDVNQIANMIKNGQLPSLFLPIDCHIIEYSKLKSLIQSVPNELKEAKEQQRSPYLPIQPKSYRKKWQEDDEAYNFVYDYLSAFTPFDFDPELKCVLDESRKRVVLENSSEELLDALLNSATDANFRRFQSVELEEQFLAKIKDWKDKVLKQEKGPSLDD